MNPILNILAIFLLMNCFPVMLMAQSLALTSVGAEIVKGITITETSPLQFGTMTIPSAPEEVILTTSNIRLASSPANIELLAQSPVSQNASYTVAGSDGASYVIMLPPNGTVTITNGAQHMDIVDFISHPASTGADGTIGHLDASGMDTFKVGATLKLVNDQAFGTYTGTFSISVNYN